MTTSPTTIEQLRDELHRLWKQEDPGEVKGLLRAAFIALNTICLIVKKERTYVVHS